MRNSGQAKKPLAEVHFPLDDRDSGVTGEDIWCEQVGSDLYRLLSVPKAVRGVCMRDIVKAKEVEGRLTFLSVAIHAGHSTYAYIALDAARFDEFWKPLAELGIEGSNSNEVVAVDIPSRADIFDVRRAFIRGQEAGVWDCEEMTCGHILPALARAS